MWGQQFAAVFSELNMPYLQQLLADILYGKVHSEAELNAYLIKPEVRADLDALHRKMSLQYTAQEVDEQLANFLALLARMQSFVQQGGIDQRILLFLRILDLLLNPSTNQKMNITIP